MDFIKKTFKIGLSIVVLLIIPYCRSAGNNKQIEELYNCTLLSEEEKIDSLKKYFLNTQPPIKHLPLADIVIETALNGNNYKWLFYGYYYKANAYYYLADTEKACEYYFKSLDALQKTDIKHIDYSVYINLGNAYAMSGDNEKSILYYMQALNSIQDRNLNYYGYTLLNIVDNYVKINKLDSAENYLTKADSIFNISNDNVGSAYVLGQRAIIHVKKESFDKASKCFAKTDSLLRIEDDEYSILNFQIELAKSFLLQKQFDRALDNLNESYQKAKELRYNEQTRDISLLLSEVYSNLGKYEKAFMYQKKYIDLNDSICNEKSIREIADIRAEYKVSQKQLEIDLLEKKQQLSKIVTISTIVILLIISLLTYLIYKNFKIVKSQRRKLIQQKQKLEGLIQTKDKMFSIISHDLRGPLHSLSGVSGLIRELIKNDDRDILVDVGDSLGKSLNSITLLLDNLLEWSLNEQGRIPFHPKEMDAFDLFVELYEIFYGPAEAKGIELNLNIEEDTLITADHNTLSTIFRNLISNAVKFSKKGDSITLDAAVTPDKIIFRIADTGVGMDKVKKESLFNFSGTKSTYGTGQERGIGLGLRLAYEFTKLNKGEITVESEVGKGTTFFVEFPK